MLDPYFHLKHHKERHKHNMSEAAHHRLVRNHLRNKISPIKWHHRLLANVGTMLIASGNRLQSHYNEVIASTSNANIKEWNINPET